MAYDKLVDSEKLDACLSESADAIRIKTGGESAIDFNNFPDEIIKIVQMRPMTLFPHGLNNGFWGNLAARICADYYYARLAGIDTFDYNDDTNIFNTTQIKENLNYATAKVRDSVGRCCIDCSSYIGLALRGIPYDKSPYATHKAAGVRWEPRKEMVYGTQGWEFEIIDQQEEGVYRDMGIDGCSSLRGAGHFAEFFAKYGYVVFDRNRDGLPTESLTELLQPGDLLFYGMYDDNGNYERAYNLSATRFRSIHHIGMVAENVSKYYHVTGSTSNTENEPTVIYSNFTNIMADIELICRPNYLHKGLKAEIPLQVNLLSYPWFYNQAPTYTDRGITMKTTGMNSIKVSGTATAEIGFRLRGNTGNEYACIKLEPGTYELSGLDGSGRKSSIFALQIRYLDSAILNVKQDGTVSPVPLYVTPGGKETTTATGNTLITEQLRAYDGHNVTFTIKADTLVQVRLYIGNGETIDGFEFTPMLKRIS